MKKQYEVSILEGKIYVDPEFVKKAGQLDSPEFSEYMRLKRELPGFPFEEKNLNVSSRFTYSKLSYDAMKDFINFYESDERKPAALAEFNRVRAESAFKKAPYSFVKSWFVRNYKEAYRKSSFAEKEPGKSNPSSNP